jgi:hypothetical protein
MGSLRSLKNTKQRYTPLQRLELTPMSQHKISFLVWTIVHPNEPVALYCHLSNQHDSLLLAVDLMDRNCFDFLSNPRRILTGTLKNKIERGEDVKLLDAFHSRLKTLSRNNYWGDIIGLRSDYNLEIYIPNVFRAIECFSLENYENLFSDDILEILDTIPF